MIVPHGTWRSVAYARYIQRRKLGLECEKKGGGASTGFGACVRNKGRRARLVSLNLGQVTCSEMSVPRARQERVCENELEGEIIIAGTQLGEKWEYTRWGSKGKREAEPNFEGQWGGRSGRKQVPSDV